jgi:hypothetical protein
MQYKDRVDPTLILPQVSWRETHNRRRLHTGISVPKAFQAATVEGAGVVVNKSRKN